MRYLLLILAVITLASTGCRGGHFHPRYGDDKHESHDADHHDSDHKDH